MSSPKTYALRYEFPGNRAQGGAVAVRVMYRAGYLARVAFWLFAYEFGWALVNAIGLTPR